MNNPYSSGESLNDTTLDNQEGDNWRDCDDDDDCAEYTDARAE